MPGSARGHHEGGLRGLDIERVLAPTLRPGQQVVVVADNLAAHKGEEVRELVEARGCELLFLPPYSPDYNPIEEAWWRLGLAKR